MSKYRKPFLRALAKEWSERLPKWKYGAYACSTGRERHKDATFSLDSLWKSHGLMFHCFVDFTPHWPDAFTGEILVTTRKEPFEGFGPLRWRTDIPTLPPGVYRIGFFMPPGYDRWWRLEDDTKEWNARAESVRRVKAGKRAPMLSRHPHHWYADSYDKPTPDILAAAAKDFTEAFCGHVLPVLCARVGDFEGKSLQ